MAIKAKYMSWIKQFAEGSFSLYSGNTIDAFQPLDFFHFYPLWYDLWVARTAGVIKKLNLEQKHFSEIKHLLPGPSSMRAILQKLIPSWLGPAKNNPTEYKLVANFFARMLMECCPSDPFGKSSNPFLNQEQVRVIFETLPWRVGNPRDAKIIGQLIAAAGSLMHGYYNDVVTDFAWDGYGPFEHDGQTLFIRHFPDIQPRELGWAESLIGSAKEIRIYGVYEGVKFRIGCVGCHPITEGSLVQGLKKYVVVVDGQPLSIEKIPELIQEFAAKAEAVYREIRQRDFEALKKLVTLQECYQLRTMYQAAGVEWRPTPEMEARFVGQPLLTGILPQGKLMTDLEEYKEIFGLNRFAAEVLKEK